VYVVESTSVNPLNETGPPEALIVTLSFVALVDNDTFVPATNVNVSETDSATTSDWPETATIPKELPPSDIVVGF